MDDGLVPNRDGKISKFLVSLNPYCSGRWSRTAAGLNELTEDAWKVLILIVVDDGLVRLGIHSCNRTLSVLILIVVDDGLVLLGETITLTGEVGLNPYCSGRWSRTL